MDGETNPPGSGLPDLPQRDLLRFLTCGSVDDGKSTLIGRLLFETGQITDDHLVALDRDSRRFGAAGDEADYALLLDGLEAEREQGITIDVAYRYFSSARRAFIVADTPGHEEYTRNMATGASTSDLAVILVDATKGLSPQTERHTRIVALFGIRRVILAVNKIDRIEADEAIFRTIEAAYGALARDVGLEAVTAIPLSARRGDNLTAPSAATPWYEGPTLLEALETAPTRRVEVDRPLRFPVQYVNRPNPTFRGYCGTLAAGVARPGDPVIVASSGQSARIERIVAWGGDLAQAEAGEAVTLVLDRDIDVARGDLLVAPHDRPAQTERFEARVLWLDGSALDPGRTYLLRIGTALTPVRVAPLDGADLALNGLADCRLTTAQPISFAAFEDEPSLGSFILIDRDTHATAAAGVALRPVGQAPNIHPTPTSATRAGGGGVVWLTGLSGAGKSTIAAALQARLERAGARAVVLDGDNLRHGLNRDLGFSPEDRAENVRRTGEVARLFADAGVLAICALISPTAADRAAVRERMGDRAYLEVFIDTPLDVCRERDPKGLYAQAAAGRLTGLTGVDAPYEPPSSPDLTIRLDVQGAEAAAALIAGALAARAVI